MYVKFDKTSQSYFLQIKDFKYLFNKYKYYSNERNKLDSGNQLNKVKFLNKNV